MVAMVVKVEKTLNVSQRKRKGRKEGRRKEGKEKGRRRKDTKRSFRPREEERMDMV